MRAVVITEKHTLELSDRPVTPLPPGHVRVKVAYCGICGSDLHLRAAEATVAGSPVGAVLGHEFVGTIEEIAPDVTDRKIGERVAGWPNGSCGECPVCRDNQSHLCPHKLANGIGLGRHDGALAESVVLRAERAFTLPESLSLEHAALTEPLAVALRAVRQGEVPVGARTAVIGAGPVGLMVALALEATGTANVLVVEVNEQRAAMVRSFGFETCTPGELDEVAGRVLGGAPRVIFECAGHESALPLAVEALHPGGRIVVVGVLFEPVSISQLLIMSKEATIIGSAGHRPVEFAEAIEMLAAGLLPADDLITGRMPLTEAERAFNELLDPATAHIKILLRP